MERSTSRLSFYLFPHFYFYVHWFFGFIYQEQTYDISSPMGSTLIPDIIRGQWFDKGKADAVAFNEMVSLQSVPDKIIVLVVTAVSHCLYFWFLHGSWCIRLKMQSRNGPLASAILFTSARTWWKHGIHFSISNTYQDPLTYRVSYRYIHHLNAWEYLKKKMPKWCKAYQERLFTKIMWVTHLIYLLFESHDIISTQGGLEYLAVDLSGEQAVAELQGIDFEALEEQAKRNTLGWFFLHRLLN